MQQKKKYINVVREDKKLKNRDSCKLQSDKTVEISLKLLETLEAKIILNSQANGD